MTELYNITDFVVKAFIHIWPYLVITVPIAVAVNLSGASERIRGIFDSGPILAIVLATIVGAFSPFCSCGVIPVIAALLMGGVPLPPVMAFWIASPSMDPEIFFLSVGTIGWDLAIWRLIGTLVMSLGAGGITHVLMKAGWIGPDILRRKGGHGVYQKAPKGSLPAPSLWFTLKGRLSFAGGVPAHACCAVTQIRPSVAEAAEAGRTSGGSGSCGCPEEVSFRKRLVRESMAAIWMVVKFMALAFVLEAFITLYVPREWITGALGGNNAWAIVMAATLGIPVYTTNLSALPLVSGLLAQGMSPAAGLAFLVAGPTTTLPAMAAVWTLVNRRIFALYVSYALGGAVLLGYAKEIWG